ncbi:MAG: hypothetical protein QXU32_06320 [Nitrososphaerales archaeon]
MAYVYEQELTSSNDEWFYVPIPKEWKGVESEKKVRIIVNDICVIVPEGIANATGELLVLRFLEAMINGKIIDYGDVQKAVEHLL